MFIEDTEENQLNLLSWRTQSEDIVYVKVVYTRHQYVGILVFLYSTSKMVRERFSWWMTSKTFCYNNSKRLKGAGEMPQQLREMSAQPEDLGLIPEYLHSGSKPLATPIPGDFLPFSAFHGPEACRWYM